MAPLPKDKTSPEKQGSSVSNGEYSAGLSGESMAPPEFQITAGSGNSEYDDFLDSIDPADNLRSEMFAGIEVLERVYDNEELLKVGVRGDYILRIKQIIHRSGFLDRKELDNLGFDTATQDGLKKFQKYSGAILEDGLIGPETMRYLDRRARYLEQDTGECPEDPTKNIEKAREKFGKEKAVEDEKSWWDGTKNELPAMQLKILNLYEKYSNGEQVNEMYISDKAPNRKFNLNFYIQGKGAQKRLSDDGKTAYDNPNYQPISDREASMFNQLNAQSDPDQFIAKVEEIAMEVQETVALIRKWTSWPNSNITAKKLYAYIMERRKNKNDVYSCFVDL